MGMRRVYRRNGNAEIRVMFDVRDSEIRRTLASCQDVRHLENRVSFFHS